MNGMGCFWGLSQVGVWFAKGWVFLSDTRPPQET